ncbi:hypothetical protein [uncultured Winogradskyella sp.]|uniref:hypothetical protein n=1 Tax=uncultured Winogradskyella sp. TaxID=395353 RepID=UPI0035169E78
MTIIDKIKYALLKTRFARYIRVVEGWILRFKITVSRPSSTVRTVLCISPYKTGTTFIAGLFRKEVAKHEPLHYISYKLLDKDFDKYFQKRMAYLNLKLECSGLWSAYVDDLASNATSKDLDYICVLRSPSSWVTSVINYWNEPFMLDFHFDIQNEFFWKNKVGVNLREFNFDRESKTNEEIIEKLISFYFDFTEKTKNIRNLTYIHLHDIKKKISCIEDLLGEKANVKNSWKRQNKNKRFIYKNDEIDNRYKVLTDNLIRNRERQ